MPVCGFYQRGHCYKGASCTFEHVGPTSNNPRPPPNRPPNRPPAARTPLPAHLAGVPRGTCKSWWQTGSCTFGIRCKHRHDRTQAGSSSIAADAGTSALQAATPDYTAIASNSSSDPFVPARSSAQRINQGILQRVVTSDSFRFVETAQVYTFLNSLHSSTKITTTWVRSQLFGSRGFGSLVLTLFCTCRPKTTLRTSSPTSLSPKGLASLDLATSSTTSSRRKQDLRLLRCPSRGDSCSLFTCV